MRSSHPATLPTSSVYRVRSPPAFGAPSLRKSTLTWLSRARVFKKYFFFYHTLHFSYVLQMPLCNHSVSGEPSMSSRLWRKWSLNLHSTMRATSTPMWAPAALSPHREAGISRRTAEMTDLTTQIWNWTRAEERQSDLVSTRKNPNTEFRLPVFRLHLGVQLEELFTLHINSVALSITHMTGADARPKGWREGQPWQQVGNLARAGGLLYGAGECQVRLRAQASSLIPRGSVPRGHDGCRPAGGWEWPGMPTEQETAVYSGMVNRSASDTAEHRGQGKAGSPSGAGSPPRPRPRNAAEVEEKQPVSGHWSDTNQTNWCFIQNNDGFVKRLQPPNESQVKSMPSSPPFYPLDSMSPRHYKEEK